MLDYTSRLGFRFLHQYQAKKEVVMNENFDRLDAILNKGVISCSIGDAPSNPKVGDLFIISDNATGTWLNHEGDLALFLGEWEYIKPSEGMIFWVNDEEKLAIRLKSGWQMMKIGVEKKDQATTSSK